MKELKRQKRLKGQKRISLLSLVSFVSLGALSAHAGFLSRGTITSSDVGKTLANGTVYVVSEDTTIERPFDSANSALYVANNATTVIYIPTNVTLTVRGGNAQGSEGAGAGIRVDSGSTLIVTGQGKLVVKGGDAASGINGSNGGNGWQSDKYMGAGSGGAGGSGGGGAAAGIGGYGGNGGSGGSECASLGSRNTNDSDWDWNGTKGNDGSKGGNGGSAGAVYLLGATITEAIGGSVGASAGSAGSNGSGKYHRYTNDYYAGGGGGGGGGGRGNAASCGIGGGGAGAGGGGSGGSGGYFWTTQTYGGDKTCPNGAGGQGGYPGGVDASRSSPDSTSGYDSSSTGGSRGSGGAAGARGDAGTLYADVTYATVTLSGAREILEVDSHPAIEYTMTFSDNWRLDPSNVTVRLGYALPSGVAPILTRENFTFNGWYTDSDGGGEKYYNADGTAVKTVFDNVGNVSLYPYWTIVDPYKVAVRVNGTGIVAGVSASGGGWFYNGTYLYLDGNGGNYVISGIETNGEIVVQSRTTCTLTLNGLTLDTSSRPGRPPLRLSSNTATINVTAPSRLVAGEGANAIAIEHSSLSITGSSALALKGGENGADIAPSVQSYDGAQVTLNTAGPNIQLGTGRLATTSGWSEIFVSQTGAQVWPVAFTNLGSNASVFWSLHVPDYTPYITIADENGTAWLWLPSGTHRFNSTVDGKTLQWLARVDGAMTTAIPYFDTGLWVDGVDAGILPEYNYKTKILTITNDCVVTGTNTEHLAGVTIGAACSVIVSNLAVNVSASTSALTIDASSAVTLILVGENEFSSPQDQPGISVATGMALQIQGDGSLKATGGENGAGIGGAKSRSHGAITILSGTVNAEGGRYAAGIGGGSRAGGGHTLISGGNVTATGGTDAAGIGGGNYGGGGTISISGGNVVARGESYGTGIGSGDRGAGTRFTMTGGLVTADGGKYGAGVGDDYNCTISMEGGTLWASGGEAALSDIGSSNSTGGSVTVTISGGSVIGYVAEEFSPAPVDWESNAVHPFDIDGFAPSNKVTVTISENTFLTHYGKNDIYSDASGLVRLWFSSSKGNPVLITAVDEAGTKRHFYIYIYPDGTWARVDGAIFVNDDLVKGAGTSSGDGWSSKGGVVTITADATVSGLSTNGVIRVVAASGVGTLTLDDLEVRTKARLASALVVTNTTCDVVLKGTNTLVASGDYSAGMEVASNATLTVKSGGTLTATGGKYAAGIGSRGGFIPPGTMIFEGGTIYATGGHQAAGIGGGYNSVPLSDSIEVRGGLIVVQGGTSAAGLGSGYSKSTLPARAVTISDGTVIASRGGNYQSGYTQINGGDTFSDLISSGNAKPVSGTSGAFVITGGSVVAMNGIVEPSPVDANGKGLCGIVVSNLEATAEIAVSGLPDGYGTDSIFADENGTICLWLPGLDEGEAYTFTAGGSTWTAAIRTSDAGMLSGRTFVPDGVAVSALSFAGSTMSFTVSSDSPEWLRLNAGSLKVRAFTSLGNDAGSTVLEPGVTVNADGTVTLSVTLPEGAKSMFFKVEAGGTQ